MPGANKRHLITFLLAVSIAFCFSVCWAEDYDIRSVHSEYLIKENGAVIVTEKIAYRLTGCFTEIYLQRPSTYYVDDREYDYDMKDLDGYCPGARCEIAKIGAEYSQSGETELLLKPKTRICDTDITAVYTYTLHPIIKGPDYARFYYPLWGGGWKKHANVNVLIKVPGNMKDARCLISPQGPGYKYITNASQAYIISEQPIYTPLKMNLIMPKEWFGGEGKFLYSQIPKEDVIGEKKAKKEDSNETQEDWTTTILRTIIYLTVILFPFIYTYLFGVDMEKLIIYLILVVTYVYVDATGSTIVEFLIGCFMAPQMLAYMISKVIEANIINTYGLPVYILLIFSPAIYMGLVYHYFGREYRSEEVQYIGEYEREPPSPHPPEEAAFFINGKFSETSLVAGIMHLVYLGYLEFEERKKRIYIKIKKKPDRNLKLHQQALLRLIRENSWGRDELDYAEFKDMVYNQWFLNRYKIWYELLEEEVNIGQYIDYTGYYAYVFGLSIINTITLIILPQLALGMIPVTILMLFVEPRATERLFWGRWTSEGRRLNLKWSNFKRYLEDFSYLKEHPPGHIKLWDYYMSYAISFNVAKKTIKAMKPEKDKLVEEGIKATTIMNHSIFYACAIRAPAFYMYWRPGPIGRLIGFLPRPGSGMNMQGLSERLRGRPGGGLR